MLLWYSDLIQHSRRQRFSKGCGLCLWHAAFGEWQVKVRSDSVAYDQDILVAVGDLLWHKKILEKAKLLPLRKAGGKS
jgi:hypothetical protein